MTKGMQNGVARLKNAGSSIKDASMRGAMYTLGEARRVMTPLILLAIGTYYLDTYGAKLGDWALRFHKINQVTFYVILAHLIRSQIFPYLDLKSMYNEDDPMFGPAFIGITVLMAAIVLGGTLGL